MRGSLLAAAPMYSRTMDILNSIGETVFFFPLNPPHFPAQDRRGTQKIYYYGDCKSLRHLSAGGFRHTAGLFKPLSVSIDTDIRTARES